MSPADTILHDQGVHVYRVTKWSVNGWNIEIHMSPVSNAFPVAYVKGRIGLASLRLTIGGPENGGWEDQAFLQPAVPIIISKPRQNNQIKNAKQNYPPSNNTP